MRYTRKARPDTNHAFICDALRKHGIHVTDLTGNGNGVPDIFSWYKGIGVFQEIKYGKTATLKKLQIFWLAKFPGWAGIARTFEEAYNLATKPERYALTADQKINLAIYWRSMTAKEVRLGTVLKVIGE